MKQEELYALTLLPHLFSDLGTADEFHSADALHLQMRLSPALVEPNALVFLQQFSSAAATSAISLETLVDHYPSI